MRIVRTLLVGTTACGALVLVGFGVRIWTFDGRLPADATADAAIVLGAAAHGGRPSPVFAGRLEYAERLLREGRVRFVIVTGSGRDDPTQPESRAGAGYLVARGADPARVLYETRSIDTSGNLCFAAQLGAAHGLRSYVVVSDPLHVPRAMWYAARFRIPASPGASPYTRYRGLAVRLLFTLREAYVFAKHRVSPPAACEVPAAPAGFVRTSLLDRACSAACARGPGETWERHRGGDRPAPGPTDGSAPRGCGIERRVRSGG